MTKPKQESLTDVHDRAVDRLNAIHTELTNLEADRQVWRRLAA